MVDKMQLEKIVREVAEKENFREYDYTSKSGSNKGDNYLSVLEIVTIEGITKLAKKKKIDVIIKAALPGEELRKYIPLHEVFEREVFFYDVLCKIYDDLQKDIDDKFKFKEHAKLVHTSLEDKQEYIVMENLKEQGFCLFDKNQSMTHEHVALVMKAYGKLHGMSFAFKVRDETAFNRLRENTPEVFAAQMESSITSFENEIAKWITYYNPNEDGTWPLIQRLKTLKNSIRSEMQANQVYTGDHPAFLHGDCWCNNFLFKYEKPSDSSVPTDVRIVDFQIVRVGNVVNDLAYFLYACTESEIYDNYLTYLKIYHDSMAQTLQALELSIDEIFPFKALLAYWNKYAPMGLLISSFIFRVNYSKPEEAISLTDVSSGNIMDAFSNNKIANEDKVEKRVKQLIKHMVDNNFI